MTWRRPRRMRLAVLAALVLAAGLALVAVVVSSSPASAGTTRVEGEACSGGDNIQQTGIGLSGDRYRARLNPDVITCSITVPAGQEGTSLTARFYTGSADGPHKVKIIDPNPALGFLQDEYTAPGAGTTLWFGTRGGLSLGGGLTYTVQVWGDTQCGGCYRATRIDYLELTHEPPATTTTTTAAPTTTTTVPPTTTTLPPTTTTTTAPPLTGGAIGRIAATSSQCTGGELSGGWRNNNTYPEYPDMSCTFTVPAGQQLGFVRFATPSWIGHNGQRIELSSGQQTDCIRDPFSAQVPQPADGSNTGSGQGHKTAVSMGIDRNLCQPGGFPPWDGANAVDGFLPESEAGTLWTFTPMGAGTYTATLRGCRLFEGSSQPNDLDCRNYHDLGLTQTTTGAGTLTAFLWFEWGTTYTGAPAEQPVFAPYECDDGDDNDGDGHIDYPFDGGCSTRYDNSELDEGEQLGPQCMDGADNDGDGLVDHPDDPGCTAPQDTSEGGVPTGGGPNDPEPGSGPDGCEWSWNPLNWIGAVRDCAIKWILDKLIETVKWLFEKLVWLVVPEDGDFLNPLIDMWDDVKVAGPFALLNVITWPAAQVNAIKTGAEGGPRECLSLPGPPGVGTADPVQHELFCSDDPSTGWRGTARTLGLLMLLFMFALWLYHFATGTIKR